MTDDDSDERRASRARSRQRIQEAIAKITGVIRDNRVLAEAHPTHRESAMRRVHEGQDEIIVLEQQLAVLEAEDELDRSG